jgi:hypothetical protein
VDEMRQAALTKFETIVDLKTAKALGMSEKCRYCCNFFGDERNFPGPLIHFVCGDVAQK